MDKGIRIQYLVTFAVSLGAVAGGMSLMWTTPVIPKFHNNETNIIATDQQISWIAAMSSPGYITGSLLTSYISDRIGRRATILSSTLFYVTGTVIVLSCTTAWWIYFTRFLWGTGTGIMDTVSAMYLAEISDKEIRGTVTVANRILFNFGSFLVMSVGPFMSYHTLSYMLLIVPTCYFVACCCIPESPYYLLKEEKVDAARTSVMKLSGNKNDEMLQERLSAMRLDVRKEMLRSGSARELFTGKRYRRALIITIGITITQTLSGPIALQEYFGRIVQDSKINVNFSTVLAIFGIVKLVAGILSSVIVDKIGRRKLLFYSYLGSGISLAIVGTYFLIQTTPSSYYAFIPLIAITLSTIESTLGYDTLAYVISAEIFPLNVRAVAMTFMNILGGVLNFLSVKGYQEMKNIAGLPGVFWFYASLAFIGAVFTYFVVPETRGKSLREIQIELQGDMYDEAVEKLNNDLNETVATTELQELREDT